MRPLGLWGPGEDVEDLQEQLGDREEEEDLHW